MDYTQINAAVKKALKQGVVGVIIDKLPELKIMIQDDRSDEDIKLFLMTIFEEVKKTKKKTPTKPSTKEDGADEMSHPIFQMTPEEFVEKVIEPGKFACSWYRKKGKLTDGTDCAGKVCGRPMAENECLGPDGKLLPYYTWRCSGPCRRNNKDTQNRSMEKLYNAVCTSKAVFASPVKHGNTPVSGEQEGDLPTRAEEVSGISQRAVSPTSFLDGKKTGLASPSASRDKASPQPPSFKVIKVSKGNDKEKTEFAVSKSPVNGRCLCLHNGDKKKVCGIFEFESPPSEFDEKFLQDVKELDKEDLEAVTSMGLEYEYMGKSSIFEGEKLELGLEVDEPEDSEEEDVQGASETPKVSEKVENEDDDLALLLEDLGPE